MGRSKFDLRVSELRQYFQDQLYTRRFVAGYTKNIAADLEGYTCAHVRAALKQLAFDGLVVGTRPNEFAQIFWSPTDRTL